VTPPPYGTFAATEAIDPAGRHAAAAANVKLARDFALGAERHLQDLASSVQSAQDRWQRDAIRVDRILSSA